MFSSFEISIRLVRPNGTYSAPWRLSPHRWLTGLWRKMDMLGALVWLAGPATYRQACRLYRQREYEAAAQLLLNLTKTHPSHAPAYFRLGLCYSKLQRWGPACRCLKRAIRMWPWRRRWARHLASPLGKRNLTAVHRPEVILHLSGMENVAYQGNMWIPVLEKLSTRVAIVTREKKIAKALRPTKLPVFYLPGMRDLEILRESGVQTVLYSGNAQKNVQLLRFHNLNHFFINHGESDKSINQTKFLMAYDKLLVAGPLAEQRLQAAGLPLRPGQVVHVGRPNLELLLRREEVFPRPVRKILYAPTWEGLFEESNYTSVGDFGLCLLTTLAGLKDVNIVLKPHPFTGQAKSDTRAALQKMKELCSSASLTLLDAEADIYPALDEADILITDISSLIAEYLHTRKPIVLTNPGMLPESRMHKNFPSSRGTYLLNNPLDVGEVLTAICQSDPKHADREASAAYILGDTNGGSLARFDAVVLSSVTLRTTPSHRRLEQGGGGPIS